ncbi:MAG: RNA methyltransferase [Ferruginibacter sp.]
MFSKTTIKYIQSLQHKKFRDQEGAFIAEGPKLVKELLEGRIFTCRHVYCLQDWADELSPALRKNVEGKLTVIRDFELDKISALTRANLVLAVFDKKTVNPSPELKGRITLVLDDIQDPGNLGTIIRIADWFGIENVVCSLQTADMYNTKVVQSTMASLQRVNLLYADVEQWLRQATGIKKYAAALHGKPLNHFSALKEGILIIGNESKGISDAVLNMADEKVTIPRIGEAESLNAAVATGVLLYEMVKP